jgi:hypothetical protein
MAIPIVLKTEIRELSSNQTFKQSIAFPVLRKFYVVVLVAGYLCQN